MYLPKHINSIECCGCGACVAICSRKAIKMGMDKRGFRYPEINEQECIKCHRCESVCSFNIDSITTENYSAEAYGVKFIDEDVRLHSRSGGAFTAISDIILEEGGIVYGCTLDENFFAIHKRAETKEERDKFRGSKYIQSNLDEIFEPLKEDLKSKRPVLFSGTTCQIAAIKKYLSVSNISDENLYLVDIICNSVPSPKVFSDYLSYIEKKHRCKVIDIDFRNKSKFGWVNHRETIKTNKGELDYNYFAKLFQRHNIVRDSCFRCPYRNTIRCGDISLGDFWGVEKVDKSMSDDKGTSLVLLHTEKGKRLFSQCKNIYKKKFPVKNCLQPSLFKQIVVPPERERFWNRYYKTGIRGAIWELNKNAAKLRIIRLFKNFNKQN